jgi:RNA polymerase sigma-70 factor (ECF subfamily)
MKTTTISKSEVMKRAWYLFKNQSVRTDKMFSNCLVTSWQISKSNVFDFDAIYKKHYSGVFNFINLILKDSMLSEEATNDTFLKVKDSYYQYNSVIAKFSTWLYKFAYNTAIDYQRKQAKENTISLSNTNEDNKEYFEIADNNNTIDIIETNEKTKQINDIINEVLTDKQKNIAVLYFIQDLSYKTISEQMQISESDVKVTIFRTRKILQSAMIKNNVTL